MKATNYLWSKLKWCVLSLFWSVWRDETKYQQIIVKSLRRNIKNTYSNFWIWRMSSLVLVFSYFFSNFNWPKTGTVLSDSISEKVVSLCTVYLNIWFQVNMLTYCWFSSRSLWWDGPLLLFEMHRGRES